MDTYTTLLAVGARDGKIYLIDTQLTATPQTLTKSCIIGKMTTSPQMPTFGNCDWMHNSVSQVRFSKSGKYLFSSSPGMSNGVTMWDVERQEKVHEYNHHPTGDWEMEQALYGQRSKHEIYSVCPTFDGDQFVSGSYSYVYHWDTRSGELIKKHAFYEEEQQRPSYNLSQIYFTKHETELLVYGRRPSKFKTYSFPAMVPTQTQFETNPNEYYGLYFNDTNGFGADCYGGFYTFNAILKQTVSLELTNAYTGSGACDCHISDSGDVVGVAFSNPQSGYFWTKLVVFSGRELFTKDMKQRKRCLLQ